MMSPTTRISCTMGCSGRPVRPCPDFPLVRSAPAEKPPPEPVRISARSFDPWRPGERAVQLDPHLSVDRVLLLGSVERDRDQTLTPLDLDRLHLAAPPSTVFGAARRSVRRPL
jgi:hypothetical protein